MYAKPRVAILSTGNEIVEPGGPLGPGQIYDINTFTLGAIIEAHGGTAVPRPTAPDNLPELVAALEGDPRHEIIIVDNASSDGSAEFIETNFPHVRVLKLERNLGFGGGSNAAAIRWIKACATSSFDCGGQCSTPSRVTR